MDKPPAVLVADRRVSVRFVSNFVLEILDQDWHINEVSIVVNEIKLIKHVGILRSFELVLGGEMA